MALTSYEMGAGVVLDGTTYIIKGKSFNPYVSATTWATSSISGGLASGSSISLTGFQYGHEILVALGKWDETGGHFIEFRKGTSSLFLRNYSGFEEVYAYIGIDYDEIMSADTDYHIDFGSLTSSSNEGFYDYVSGSNSIDFGTYSPIFYAGISNGDSITVSFYDWDGGSGITFRTSGTYIVSSKSSNLVYFTTNIPQSINANVLLCLGYKGKSVQATLDFTITNFPSVTEATAGYIWVEGDNICFIGAEKTTTGYKHIIKHDGSTYGGSATPGMLWVDQANHGKLAYVDSSGILRKTHTGDINGSPGNNEATISGKTPGMMWVSSPLGNYGYLTFIGYDGNGYRIMNGTV